MQRVIALQESATTPQNMNFLLTSRPGRVPIFLGFQATAQLRNPPQRVARADLRPALRIARAVLRAV
jgi:hypothetical protein